MENICTDVGSKGLNRGKYKTNYKKIKGESFLMNCGAVLVGV